MPRIAPLPHDHAEGTAKDLLDAVKKSLGVTPNMTTTMARSSALEAWLGFGAALRKGSIRGADGERIALGVAERNGCVYCLSAHTYLGTNVAGLDPSEIESARSFRSADPSSQAILAFAEAVLESRGHVGQDEFDAARAAGLTDAQLADIVGHVAVNVFTNSFNSAFQVDVDFPAVQPRDAAAR